MTQPKKTAPITKKMEQPIKMSPVPTQPMKMVPTIPKILQQITNKK